MTSVRRLFLFGNRHKERFLKPFLLSSCRKKKWFQTSVEERTPDGCFSLVLMLLCAVRYAVLSGRRIDFPRPPGHRCASRFSLPDGRDKRGAASKFARFIRHRRRFAHFHRPAPPCARRNRVRRSFLQNGPLCEREPFSALFIPKPDKGVHRQNRNVKQRTVSRGKEKRFHGSP